MEPLLYRGKFAEAVVMIDDIEMEAVTQIYQFLNHPAFEGAKIVIQPDCHAGAGAVIGFTSTLTDKIIPNVIGVDIGCGVLAYKLGKLDIDFKELDAFLRKNIPSGFSVHNTSLIKEYAEFEQAAEETEQDTSRVLRSLGTLGGGNHFIELDKDDNEEVWLVIHSGSRNFGLKIAQYHQAKAVKTVGKGHGLEWLEGDDAEYYLQHMKVAQHFASFNRKLMADILLTVFFRMALPLTKVESVHNYINFKDKIIRKGAISAHKDERVIIPWNMRDGIIIGKGKGNPNWNYSAPHGAGRIMGRGAAKRTLDLDDFKKAMEGIWTSCVSQETIDESPFVYKDYRKIRDVIQDTVDIEFTLKPIFNFKASHG